MKLNILKLEKEIKYLQFYIALLCLIILIGAFVFLVFYNNYNKDKYFYVTSEYEFGFSSWCRDNCCVDENNKCIYVKKFIDIRE